MSEENEVVKCPRCGTELVPNALFCSKCGFNLKDNQETPTRDATANATPEEKLMRAYITGSDNPKAHEDNYDHYREAFIKFENFHSKISWNWGTFWYGELNFWYRKNYLVAIILFILRVALCVVSGTIIDYNSYLDDVVIILIVIGISIIYTFVVSMFADYINYKRYKIHLVLAKNNYPDDLSNQIKFMAERGGITKTVFLVLIILIILGLITKCCLFEFY